MGSRQAKPAWHRWIITCRGVSALILTRIGRSTETPLDPNRSPERRETQNPYVARLMLLHGFLVCWPPT